jgi:hypothetical protein
MPKQAKAIKQLTKKLRQALKYVVLTGLLPQAEML